MTKATVAPHQQIGKKIMPTRKSPEVGGDLRAVIESLQDRAIICDGQTSGGDRGRD